MNSEEYNNCVEIHADGIYRFILKNIRNRDDAQDIVQNSFEILWKNIENVNVEKSKSYLYTVANNNMIDFIRKNKRINYQEEIDEHVIQSRPVNFDLKETLEKAFNQLPKDQKTVVLLRDYEGYSYDEIAEITGLSASQVKVYIYRARITLKNYLVSIEKLI